MLAFGIGEQLDRGGKNVLAFDGSKNRTGAGRINGRGSDGAVSRKTAVEVANEKELSGRLGGDGEELRRGRVRTEGRNSEREVGTSEIAPDA
jgi:hypothetical protein